MIPLIQEEIRIKCVKRPEMTISDKSQSTIIQEKDLKLSFAEDEDG